MFRTKLALHSSQPGGMGVKLQTNPFRYEDTRGTASSRGQRSRALYTAANSTASPNGTLGPKA